MKRTSPREITSTHPIPPTIMSLHVDLNEDAKTEMEKARRKNLLSSIVVSILTFILLGLIFYAAKIIVLDKHNPTFITYTQQIAGSEEASRDELPTASATAVTPTVSAIITSTAPTPINLPTVNVPADRPAHISPGISLGNISMGRGSSGGTPLPSIYNKRCSPQDRLQRIQQSGGSPKYEDSVVRSLRWMLKKQNPDGSWGSGPNKASYAGLSLLAYLAHCETPYSEEFGESCQKAISYLIGIASKNNGYLSENPKDQYLPYEHAINTYALAEAYTFCIEQNINIEKLKETVQTAYDLIVKNQAHDGSWMYYYRQKAEGSESYPDMSISGWNIQALKAVQHSPLKPAGNTLQKARNFVLKMARPKTGLWLYNGTSDASERASMVPVGVLSLQLMGLGHLKEARAGLKYIDENIKPTPDNAYIYYYAAQALINRGGPAWNKFGKTLGDALVSSQKEAGNWDIPDEKTNKNFTLWTGHINGEGRVHYLTCLNTLTLEVYYRFLPATGDGTRNVTGGQEP